MGYSDVPEGEALLPKPLLPMLMSASPSAVNAPSLPSALSFAWCTLDQVFQSSGLPEKTLKSIVKVGNRSIDVWVASRARPKMELSDRPFHVTTTSLLGCGALFLVDPPLDRLQPFLLSSSLFQHPLLCLISDT